MPLCKACNEAKDRALAILTKQIRETSCVLLAILQYNVPPGFSPDDVSIVKRRYAERLPRLIANEQRLRAASCRHHVVRR